MRPRGSCIAARAAEFAAVSPAHSRVAHAVQQRRAETMGTEVVILTLTVALYLACAGFVRLCDRI
jgi:hypothetical protein